MSKTNKIDTDETSTPRRALTQMVQGAIAALFYLLTLALIMMAIATLGAGVWILSLAGLGLAAVSIIVARWMHHRAKK